MCIWSITQILETKRHRIVSLLVGLSVCLSVCSKMFPLLFDSNKWSTSFDSWYPWKVCSYIIHSCVQSNCEDCIICGMSYAINTNSIFFSLSRFHNLKIMGDNSNLYNENLILSSCTELNKPPSTPPKNNNKQQQTNNNNNNNTRAHTRTHTRTHTHTKEQPPPNKNQCTTQNTLLLWMSLVNLLVSELVV